MSIYFDFKVGPKGRMFRRAVDQDQQHIDLFWNREETATLFPDTNLGVLIELSTLAICMLDQKLDVTGFMALCDHPPIPSVDPADWEIWVRNMFQKYYLSHNTLFIHFMCCMETVSNVFLEEALMSVFMNDFYLKHIILVVPPTCEIDCASKYPAFKRRTMYKNCDKTHEDHDYCLTLFVAHRKDFCPKLKLRRAVEEDNDDIVDILDRHCPKLAGIYGKYYVSEILARHPESNRKVIVAEEQEKVVGVMCLCSDINYNKMQSLYELGPYHGLVKATPEQRENIKRQNDLLKTFGEPVKRGQWSPFENLPAEDDHSCFIDEVEPKDKVTGVHKPSRVNFIRGSPSCTLHHSQEECHQPSMTSSKFSLGTIESFFTILLDDELLEYDIVNIDTHLFSVPEVPSIEILNLQTNHKSEILETARKSFSMPNKKRKYSTIKLEDICHFFEGKPNAFMIEIFGMHPEVDNGRAFDLLEAAFECMPTYDYCIIRVPCTNRSFDLLQHFCFVPLRPFVCCRYALYVAHRSSVFGKFRVRKADLVDIPQIAQFLPSEDGKEIMSAVEQSIAGNRRHSTFLLFAGASIVGLGILDPPEYIELIKTKFVLEAFQHAKYQTYGQGVDCGFMTLKTAIAYPVFEPHFAFFARELLRLSGSNTLVWSTAYKNKLVAREGNALISAMTPLPLRKNVESAHLSELRRVYNMNNHLYAFSTWFMTKKLSNISKLNVDSRIVVVGASRTAMAFLTHLLMGDASAYLTMTNVTLVSTNGLPYVRRHLRAAQMMFPRFESTSDRFLKSTPFTYYVNVVQGTMVEIDQRDNYIVTDRGGRIHYDMLFLFVGRQYQHPDYLRSLREKEREYKLGNIPKYIRVDDPMFSETQLEPPTEYDTPENVFFINTIAEATDALQIVEQLTTQVDEYKLCVYGASIEAYCCLSALLEMEVPPNRIVFVEPFPPEDPTKPRVPIFCNEKVDYTVMTYMEKLGITVYRGYYFQSWACDVSNVLYNVHFLSQTHSITVECYALFYYGKRSIDPHAFVVAIGTAINRCGIPYDGGILIDHRCRTNHPSIYAAGPSTRYYRRCNADTSQKFYDSYEVGKMLGKQILNQLDPLFPQGINENMSKNTRRTSFVSNDNYDSSTSTGNMTDLDENQIPKFHRPIAIYCTLPGELQYLEVRPPGPKFVHYYIQGMEYNGTILETFSSGYFKLHLTKDLVVDGITCLTRSTHSIQNFRRLYGISSIALNNVHSRFEKGTIKDFFHFFREPWSTYIYNEQCLLQLLALVKYVTAKNDPQGKTLEQTLRHLYENISMTSLPGTLAEDMEVIHTVQEEFFEPIADYVVEWLNDLDLAQPAPWREAFKKANRAF